MHTHTQIYIHPCMHTLHSRYVTLRYVTLHYITYTHIRIYTYTHIHICAYTHHIHIYTYTHIHIYTCSWIVFTSIIYYNIFHTIRSRTSRGVDVPPCHIRGLATPPTPVLRPLRRVPESLMTQDPAALFQWSFHRLRSEMKYQQFQWILYHHFSLLKGYAVFKHCLDSIEWFCFASLMMPA